MMLWRIYPVAAPGDPRWQAREIWEEVIVRASGAAFARVVASRLDGQRPRYSLGNESQSYRSGFMDDKLYWVRRLKPEEAARYEAAGPPDVLAARKLEPKGAPPGAGLAGSPDSEDRLAAV